MTVHHYNLVAGQVVPSYIIELERKMISKDRDMEKKEQGVTMMVGIILATFLICTIPAAIVMETDPTADKHPWVRNMNMFSS